MDHWSAKLSRWSFALGSNRETSACNRSSRDRTVSSAYFSNQQVARYPRFEPPIEGRS